MNYTKIKSLLVDYKQYFDVIRAKEGFKWKAVKTFQREWNNPIIKPFHEKLDASIQDTGKLLVSTMFLARSSIVFLSKEYPVEIEACFDELFKGSDEWYNRVKIFQTKCNSLFKNYTGPARDTSKNWQSFQTSRAVMVYLCMMYPDKYFLWKTTMFEKFASLVEYRHTNSRSGTTNLQEYTYMCSIIRDIIAEDEDLVAMHFASLDTEQYSDYSLHILTQDFIYACVEHLPKLYVSQQGTIEGTNYAEPEGIIDSIEISTEDNQIVFCNTRVDYEERDRRNRLLGKLGEEALFNFILKRLNEGEKLEHTSKEKGDGWGHDLLIRKGKNILKYIEVKTTSGAYETPFYFTATELFRSVQDSDKFELWRLYSFDRITGFFKFQVHHGSLANLTRNPIQFKVLPQKQNENY